MGGHENTPVFLRIRLQHKVRLKLSTFLSDKRTFFGWLDILLILLDLAANFSKLKYVVENNISVQTSLWRRPVSVLHKQSKVACHVT